MCQPQTPSTAASASEGQPQLLATARSIEQSTESFPTPPRISDVPPDFQAALKAENWESEQALGKQACDAFGWQAQQNLMQQEKYGYMHYRGPSSPEADASTSCSEAQEEGTAELSSRACVTQPAIVIRGCIDIDASQHPAPAAPSPKSLVEAAQSRRPCHLQICTGPDDLSAVPSPSTRPASTMTAVSAPFDRQATTTDSLVASSPSRMSDIGGSEASAICVPLSQPLPFTTESTQAIPAQREEHVEIVGRGIVKSFRFDNDGADEAHNVFDMFSARAAVEEAVAAVGVPRPKSEVEDGVPSEVAVQSGISSAAADLPVKKTSDWSYGTPVYRSPVAASEVSIGSSWTLECVSRPAVEEVADDAASQATVVAPEDPDRLNLEPIPIFTPQSRSGSDKTASPPTSPHLEMDKELLDNAAVASGIALTLVGSPQGTTTTDAQGTKEQAPEVPAEMNITAAFRLFGEDSPQDALAAQLPDASLRHEAELGLGALQDSSSPVAHPPVPPPPAPLPEEMQPKTIWHKKDSAATDNLRAALQSSCSCPSHDLSQEPVLQSVHASGPDMRPPSALDASNGGHHGIPASSPAAAEGVPVPVGSVSHTATSNFGSGVTAAQRRSTSQRATSTTSQSSSRDRTPSRMKRATEAMRKTLRMRR